MLRFPRKPIFVEIVEPYNFFFIIDFPCPEDANNNET
jgi:hypothetical protein